MPTACLYTKFPNRLGMKIRRQTGSIRQANFSLWGWCCASTEVTKVPYEWATTETCGWRIVVDLGNADEPDPDPCQDTKWIEARSTVVPMRLQHLVDAHVVQDSDGIIRHLAGGWDVPRELHADVAELEEDNLAAQPGPGNKTYIEVSKLGALAGSI